MYAFPLKFQVHEVRKRGSQLEHYEWWHFLDIGTGGSLLYKLQIWDPETTHTISKGNNTCTQHFKLLNFKTTFTQV